MNLLFSGHALKRMFERAITVQEVKHALLAGKVIREYPDDKPYPSRLVLYWNLLRPIHVVAADDKTGKLTYIITVYVPDAAVWNSDLTERRPL
jgi:hypothetical protein